MPRYFYKLYMAQKKEWRPKKEEHIHSFSVCPCMLDKKENKIKSLFKKIFQVYE